MKGTKMDDEGWIDVSTSLPKCKAGSETEVMVCYEDDGHPDYTRVFAYWLNKSELFPDDDSEQSTKQTGFFQLHENVFEPIYDVVVWQYLPIIPHHR